MFRKIILAILVLSPLWYSLFIGYPIISDEEHRAKQKERPGISISKRCFGVGDFKEFRKCLSESEEIKGMDLANEVSGKINQISEVFTFILIIGLTIFIIAAIILI